VNKRSAGCDDEFVAWAPPDCSSALRAISVVGSAALSGQPICQMRWGQRTLHCNQCRGRSVFRGGAIDSESFREVTVPVQLGLASGGSGNRPYQSSNLLFRPSPLRTASATRIDRPFVRQ